MAVEPQLRATYKLPRGQWEFEQDGHVFTAMTPGLLIEEVRAYRVANNLSTLNLTNEVVLALIKTHPEVGNAPVGQPEALEPPPETLSDRVLTWMRQYSGPAPKYAHAIDSFQRVKICAKCPQNVHVYGEGMERLLLLLTRGSSLRDDGLGGCACFEHHNKLAVILSDYKGKSPTGEVPAECWAK